jgi:hypothetical protein
MIAPLKVSSNHIAATILTVSMQLSARTGVRLEQLPVVIGKRGPASQGRNLSTLRNARRSTLKKDLTEPTLLEMSRSCHDDAGLAPARVNCAVLILTVLGPKEAEMRMIGCDLHARQPDRKFRPSCLFTSQTLQESDGHSLGSLRSSGMAYRLWHFPRYKIVPILIKINLTTIF